MSGFSEFYLGGGDRGSGAVPGTEARWLGVWARTLGWMWRACDAEAHMVWGFAFDGVFGWK